MKIINIPDLYAVDLCVSELSVIFQTPQWTSLGGLGEGDSPRKLNGFLLIKSGKCRYEWVGGSADLEAGDLIYLPTGAKRFISVTENDFSFYRISFKLFDLKDKKEILFSKNPYIAAKKVSYRPFDICERLKIHTLSSKNNLKSLSLFYELLSSTTKGSGERPIGRISPAIDHIEKHYTENFEIPQLAALCYLSAPHFFRLFKKEVGKSPIEYRNHLRIQRAKSLLLDDECQIGEIAVILGFDSIYYFSRCFKKTVGLSPSEYRAKNGVTL